MKVIAVAQQKGGVGKTMIAIHLAGDAEQDNPATVIIELDKQGTASLWSERRGSERTPHVMRVESNALAKALRALRDGGADLAILDLPGAHSPAITPAIKAFPRRFMTKSATPPMRSASRSRRYSRRRLIFGSRRKA